MKEKDLYVCYSIKQHNYLNSIGIRYLITGLSITTNKQFYVYYRDDKLDKALSNWTRKENMR